MSGALATATREPEKASSGRRGSRFFDKQIAQSVKDRKQIQIHAADGHELAIGWVFGLDDYHLGLVDRGGVVRLIHKSAAAMVTMLGGTNWSGSEAERVVSPIIEPFRERVMREHFGQTSATQ